ncbi:hypothetical protein EAE99_007038 [Botrytis elliptica]|nr:hypothetical protein EAE99_007038 [Botrytis elliptica]
MPSFSHPIITLKLLRSRSSTRGLDLLPHHAHDGRVAHLERWLDRQRLARRVPRGAVRARLGRVAAGPTEADGDAKDAQVAAGLGGLLVQRVDLGGRGTAEGDLVAEAGDHDELRDAGEGLDFLGGVATEAVGLGVEVPVSFWVDGNEPDVVIENLDRHVLGLDLGARVGRGLGVVGAGPEGEPGPAAYAHAAVARSLAELVVLDFLVLVDLEVVRLGRLPGGGGNLGLGRNDKLLVLVKPRVLGDIIDGRLWVIVTSLLEALHLGSGGKSACSSLHVEAGWPLVSSKNKSETWCHLRLQGVNISILGGGVVKNIGSRQEVVSDVEDTQISVWLGDDGPGRRALLGLTGQEESRITAFRDLDTSLLLDELAIGEPDGFSGLVGRHFERF